MAEHSAIEWTDATWNPVRGCVPISPGCAHCYAETFAERFRGVPRHPYEQGFDLRLVPEKLAEPLSWKTPRRVFVNSMSDLFQDGVADEYIDQVFAVMALAPQHTFQVLTKRAERMRTYTQRIAWSIRPLQDAALAMGYTFAWQGLSLLPWPIPNVWLGVSVENKRTRDDRIPKLLKTPATVKFISAEPLLEDIADDEMFSAYLVSGYLEPPQPDKVHWVIVGGESGAGARPFDITWARRIVRACRRYHTPVFVKQLGAKAYDPNAAEPTGRFRTNPDSGHRELELSAPRLVRHKKGGDMAEWPEDLRVREWPAR